MSSPAYPAGMNPQLLDFLRDWQQAWSSLPVGSGPAQRRAHFETVARAMGEPDAPGLHAREHAVDGPEGGEVAYQAAFGLPAREFPGYLVGYEVLWTNGARVRGRCHLGFRDHELSFPVGYALEELARPGCAAYTTTTPEQRAVAERILRECDLPRWRENYRVMRRLHPDLPALF